MLKAIGFIIKVAAFASLVLVIGNWAKWEGKTLSERVREGLAQADRSRTAAKVRELTRALTQDAREGAEKKIAAKPGNRARTSQDRTPSGAAAPTRTDSEASGNGEKESLPSSERQKLRDLIRELNSSDR